MGEITIGQIKILGWDGIHFMHFSIRTWSSS